ncbi:RNA-guided endonuclease InsQ/TnpB family protein [Lacticaseibacillus porcinae]|uniref:RNA-guided endonuclease InsQ/TnpB family protein n=1 Tax=Lacticaseibacillus porcinae TaxID=1123687 RepID=UPI000F78B8BC|nr:RNA-guided endonuclease TnpB family protein [Lacticaseibacillus porcinae]
MAEPWVQEKRSRSKTFAFTEKLKVTLSCTQILQHERALVVQDQLFNYSLNYMYKTYGRKHIDRNIPTGLNRHKLINLIIKKFLNELYQLQRWNVKALSLSSHNAQLFLQTLIVNFAEYQKLLRAGFKWSDKIKFQYKQNIIKDKRGKHKNPHHNSWYKRGHLSFNLKSRTRAVEIQKNTLIQILSAHVIKVPNFGILHLHQNATEYNFTDIKIIKLKRKGDGTYQLQLVHVQPKAKSNIQAEPAIGVDWNMTNNVAYHDSNNKQYQLPQEVIAKADRFEQHINKLKRKRSLMHGRTKNITKKIQKVSAKRAQLLNEAYRKIAIELVGSIQVLVMEKLGAKDMRKSTGKAKNRKLALLKPYEAKQVIQNRAFKQGVTVVEVDAYKTSQVEYGTDVVDKHPLSQREWISPITGKVIDRDHNAAQNILEWGLHPSHHIKVKIFPKVTAAMVSSII